MAMAATAVVVTNAVASSEEPAQPALFHSGLALTNPIGSESSIILVALGAGGTLLAFQLFGVDPGAHGRGRVGTALRKDGCFWPIPEVHCRSTNDRSRCNADLGFVSNK